MEYVSLNGRLQPANGPVISAGNRSFKYGDGVFETMRLSGGRIILSDFHFQRLLRSLALLKIDHPADFHDQLVLATSNLTAKHGTPRASKVRLAVFREPDNRAGFLIEESPLPGAFYEWNNEGWQLALYEDARKSNDVFANLKSANYLPYLMAQLHAADKGVDECLLLNTNGAIADGSRTNVFILRHKELLTPSLSSGCVDGVMRRFIISTLHKTGQAVLETELDRSAIEGADEVFLTNAVQGIRWVKRFGSKDYRNEFSHSLFERLAELRPT
jgi:branched-chain amino acid aminotransferase